jgi:hypothetical protein
MALKKNYIIEKRNILNEIREDFTNQQEIKLFCIYL